MPHVFTEGKVDMEKLRAPLGGSADERSKADEIIFHSGPILLILALMRSSHRHVVWGFLPLGLAGIAAVWLAGCVVIPVNHYETGSRRKVNAKSLKPGVTTKEELVHRLGEPDFYSEDGQRIAYAWTKVKAIWVVQNM